MNTPMSKASIISIVLIVLLTISFRNSVDGFCVNKKLISVRCFTSTEFTSSGIIHHADMQSTETRNNVGSSHSDKGILKNMSPGALLLSPLIVLLGLDLIANIAVLTKRSMEVLFTGEYTVWTPWQ